MLGFGPIGESSIGDDQGSGSAINFQYAGSGNLMFSGTSSVFFSVNFDYYEKSVQLCKNYYDPLKLFIPIYSGTDKRFVDSTVYFNLPHYKALIALKYLEQIPLQDQTPPVSIYSETSEKHRNKKQDKALIALSRLEKIPLNNQL